MDEETVRNNLIECIYQSDIRGLKQSVYWAREMIYCLPDSDELILKPLIIKKDYGMGKSCFDKSEFQRAAFFTQNSVSKEGRFLHFYSRYMSAEKKRLDLMVEINPFPTSSFNDDSLALFRELRIELHELWVSGELKKDSYLLYVYAIVLLKLDLTREAVEALTLSVNVEPLNWSSWNQLAVIIEDKPHLDSLELPSHWFKKFFLSTVYLELQMNEEALVLYSSLLQTFKNCDYIKTQMAIARHNLREVDIAIDLFESVRESDPNRLDAMDIYSNLLYVKDMRPKLSSLAHAANNIDPYRVETCCCIANFYSLRGQHNRAADYFSRALQLNPRHISAWTLMGHEYMEIKNTGAAIQAYRSAIECNRRDYRAWYGLGQTYEILKMPSYCLFYYSAARCLRPNDSRMIIATGETLEKLERKSDAIKCYWKAGGTALYKLASLYENSGEKDKAAAAFSDFINRAANAPNADSNPDLSHAYKFLANYYLTKNKLKSAHSAAQKCQSYPETREEGKNILKQIASLSKGRLCDD